MQKIPTISFNDLKDRNSDVLEFLTGTLENNGFFIINDHSIDKNLIEFDNWLNFTLTCKYLYRLKLSISIICYKTL